MERKNKTITIEIIKNGYNIMIGDWDIEYFATEEEVIEKLKELILPTEK